MKRDDERVAYMPLHPYVLFRADARGLEYYHDVVIFYNHLEKKLIFDTPGAYAITLHHFVPPVQISVLPAEDEAAESACRLLDPNGFLFLEFGISENQATRAQAISRLAEVCQQYPGTQLGMWASARLGVEYFEAYVERQSGTDPNQLAAPLRVNPEELQAKARTYLTRGYELEDAFPLREEALYALCRVESLLGNAQKAASLFQECASKYPHGRYGRNAASAARVSSPTDRRTSPDTRQSASDAL
ncbi:MAG: hypothetical protein JW993_17700 [Sedimentisphaerales bacterium]|nr:hypothetical protein [Sedimentisphaerales bacterium]